MMRVMAMLKAIPTIQPMVARQFWTVKHALALAPMRVWVAAFSLGWQEESKQGIMIAVRCILMLALCAVWHRIWLATDLGNITLPFSVSVNSLMRYLLVTEWVTFAVGYRYRDIADPIQSGRVFSLLSRPIPYWQYSLANNLGGVTWMMMVMGITVVVGSWWLIGHLPAQATQIPLALISLSFGCIIWTMIQMMIGAAAAWLGNITPLYWIVQKTMYVLGGLMLPLFFLPSWCQNFAWITPFPAILYLSGVAASEQTLLHWWQILAIQLAWLIIIFCLMVITFNRAEKRLMSA
jgi:ABC-2 type transport system permease protein